MSSTGHSAMLCDPHNGKFLAETKDLDGNCFTDTSMIR